MFIAKLKEFAVSGKLALVIRIAFVALVLASSFLATGEVFAGPMPGGAGG